MVRRGIMAAAAAAGAATMLVVVMAVVMRKHVGATSLILPWYEVVSTGDGTSPESVNVWSIPPTVSYAPNTFQDPTKWNGDHVLNGGNKEWAEEDAALHAYNMENWRNKILETQVRRQVKQYDLMNTMRHRDGYKSGSRSSVLAAKKSQSMDSSAHDQQVDLKKLASLLASTSKQVDPAGSGDDSDRGGSFSQLVKVEEKNGKLLRRILDRLHETRRERRSGRGGKQYVRHLERQNRHMLRQIKDKLEDLQSQKHVQ